jgi:hypothetical protein
MSGISSKQREGSSKKREEKKGEQEKKRLDQYHPIPIQTI